MHALNDHDLAALAGTQTLLQSLCADSGCAVAVANREGEIVYANERSRAWMRWHLDQTGKPADTRPTIRHTCREDLLEERLEFVRRVCDQRVWLLYESLSRGMRHLVSLRPIDSPDGDHSLCFTVARRMRPWERIIESDWPGATIVHPQHHDAGLLEQLSPREMEVLVLIGQGLAYAQIAERLHRSVRTIERHRDRICQKLDASNRVELARIAIRAGLAELPDPADAAMLADRPYDPLQLSEPVRRISHQRGRATLNRRAHLSANGDSD